MSDAIDSILPVATLLLGAGLANFLKFTELRRSLRLDAADQLAELSTLLWNKTDPDATLDICPQINCPPLQMRARAMS
jgi:hypothetical protein